MSDKPPTKIAQNQTDWFVPRSLVGKPFSHLPPPWERRVREAHAIV